jgi:hypothetical protein
MVAMLELRQASVGRFTDQRARAQVAETSVRALVAGISLAILFVASGRPAIGAEDRKEQAQIAVDHMAEETLECAAYFDIVSLALINSNDSETADYYINARKLAVDRAESLNEGILNRRYEAFVQDMSQRVIRANLAKKIDPKLSNISIEDVSILRDRYAASCKQIIENPGSRAKYWMEQKP